MTVSDLLTAWNAEVANLPQWVRIWMIIMPAVLALSIPFSFVRVEARWILLGFVLGIGGVLGLFGLMGYSRLVGLGHIVFWTPLLVYLVSRRAHWRVRDTWAGKWILAAVLVLTISLAFDYTDAARWLLGER